MYAHQVIEDFPNIKIPFIRDCINSLLEIEHYHIGDTDNIFNLTRKTANDSSFYKYIKLPHDACWVDCKCIKNNRVKNIICSKMGFQISIINQFENDQLFIIPFLHLKTNGEKKGLWTFYQYGILLSANRTTQWAYDISKDPVQQIPWEDLEETSDKMLRYFASLVSRFLVLLNCKNIISQKIIASKKLNKKRQRNKKQPIFNYHVLNIDISNKNKKDYRPGIVPIDHNRVHLCRGHFKEFTKEHPLFGRITGLFWWQPHVRGQNKDGIVMKDYNVQSNAIT